MKIQVDGKTVLELNETQKKVIQNDIAKEEFQKDMERRVNWVLTHKYERCMERLAKEWEGKLRERVESVPTNRDALAELIFSQPDYKSRSQKNFEEIEHEKMARTGQI